MSLTYPDLTNKFPDQIDDNRVFQDATNETKALVDQYYTYKENGDDTSAEALLTANPVLKDIIFNASTVQLLYDMQISQQRFYFSDFQKYITTAVKYKGEYNASTQYVMFNVVTYNYKSYMCMSNACPIGTLPTNTAYWTLQTIQGQSGTGMAFYSTWDNTVAYKVQDCVPYGGYLYVCIQAHTNQNPSTATAYWSPIISIPKQIAINTSQPSSQATDDVWYEILA